jgi:transcriptional regulator with XRE-family HTH domain
MQKETIRLILGLKIHLLRQQQGLTLQQLADKTSTTVSYLHDIEKGKKYPSSDKIMAFSKALGIEYDELVALHGIKKLQPIVELLESEFFTAFPLDMFGLKTDRVIDLMSEEPDKISAFVSTILKIARNYHVTSENLYAVALRSFQDLHDNYFPEIERAADAYRLEHGLGAAPLATHTLEQTLLNVFGIAVDRDKMADEPTLRGLRSYAHPEKRCLFLNKGLSDAQENFLLAREIGFQCLNLHPRSYETMIRHAESFEQLLNNFRASYFASVLLMPADVFARDVQQCAASLSWQPEAWLALIEKYRVTAEMFMQRLTNILPGCFGLKDLFFIRLEGDTKGNDVEMTKELHLNGQQSPSANERAEHYCRRWISINILKELAGKSSGEVIVAVQNSAYWQTENTYFCLSMAKTLGKSNTKAVSVTLGLRLNDALRRFLKCVDDPAVPLRTVHTTCERCSISDCKERMAPDVVVQQQLVQVRQDEAFGRL